MIVITRPDWTCTTFSYTIAALLHYPYKVIHVLGLFYVVFQVGAIK